MSFMKKGGGAGEDLEAELTNILEVSKQKLEVLNQEIEAARNENQELQDLTIVAEEEKQMAIDKHQDLIEQLEEVKQNTKELQGQKVELQKALKLTKEDLAQLIDSAEKTIAQFKSLIKKDTEEEKKLKLLFEREKSNFEKAHQPELAKFERLKDNLQAKEEQINLLKLKLKQFSTRDYERLQNIEQEHQDLNQMN